MLCEKIMGYLADFPGKKTDYVTIEWYERRKKLHRKTSANGADIALRLGDAERELRQDNVIGIEEDTAYAVDIPAFEVLRIIIAEGHRHAAETVCGKSATGTLPFFGEQPKGNFLSPGMNRWKNCWGKFMA